MENRSPRLLKATSTGPIEKVTSGKRTLPGQYYTRYGFCYRKDLGVCEEIFMRWGKTYKKGRFSMASGMGVKTNSKAVLVDVSQGRRDRNQEARRKRLVRKFNDMPVNEDWRKCLEVTGPKSVAHFFRHQRVPSLSR